MEMLVAVEFIAKVGEAVLRLGHHQNDQTHGEDDDLDDKVQHIQCLLIL